MSAAVGFTVGFSRVDPNRWPPPEPPQYGPWDSTELDWWRNVLHEAWIARADYIAPVTRSKNPLGDDPGWSSPLQLPPLVDALQLALDHTPASSIPPGGKVPLLAPFLDTGAHRWTWTHLTTGTFAEGTVDLADPEVWTLFWKHDLAHFFNTVPSHQLFRIDGRVLVFFWGASPGQGFLNQEGNLSRLLARLRIAAMDEFGYDLFVVTDKSWPALDTTFDESTADGVNDWFDPWQDQSYTVRGWKGETFGMAVPGFINPSDSSIRVDRRDGDALREAF